MMTYKAGPYRVIAHTGAEYTIVNLQTDVRSVVHIDRLSPFEFDAINTDPKEVARSDGGLLHVEKVLQHKGNVNKNKDFFALVRWKGLTKKNDTWKHYY